MLGRLVQTADFERVLASPARSRSVHFAIHHVAQAPVRARARAKALASTELSTADAPSCAQPVDESPAAAPQGWWLGTVVPKRHARRSVTRTLVKRQIRAAMQAHAECLSPGLWVVRLRAPLDAKKWPSAASDALRDHTRGELGQLFQRLQRGG